MNVAGKLKKLKQRLDNKVDCKELTTYEICYMGNSYRLYNLGVEIESGYIILVDEEGALVNNIDKIPNIISTTLIGDIFINVGCIDIYLTNNKTLTVKILD